jgi:TonB family protein
MRAEKEVLNKAKQLEAEQRARRLAEEERQQTEELLLQAEDEVKRKTEEVELEQQTRIKIEEELHVLRLARLKAEQEAHLKAKEIETERHAKLESDRRRREAELALQKAEQEADERVRQAEEKTRGLTVLEHQTDETKRWTEEPSTTGLRTCPRCHRSFGPTQPYCLYDFSRLIDPPRPPPVFLPKPSRANWQLILALSIVTFFGTIVIGFILINQYAVASIPPDRGEPVAVQTDRQTEEPVVKGVLNSKATALVNPEYPAEAKERGLSGKVTVEVFVDRDGTVMRAKAVTGDPRLRDAAVAAAMKTKFASDRLTSQSQLTSGTITYTFKY